MSVRDQDNLTGYKEKTAELLRKRNIAVGDTLTIRTSENEFTGILMPRYESASKNHIVIKLTSGYNIGIATEKVQSIAKITKPTQDFHDAPATNHVTFVDSFKRVGKEYKINQTINQSATLDVSASATDADIPTNTLTFSLLSPPVGMNINPASGQINWTPSAQPYRTTLRFEK